ncbi:vitrin-like [Ptychodera flava]|uniref:vitrin-like n=1 Tax=Ptychodera flava TaxID=63121 RepID=UPI00396A9A40
MKLFTICLLMCLVFNQGQATSKPVASFLRNFFGSCEVSQWSPWSSRPISGCSTVTRTRTIIRQGRNCPTELSQSETRCGRPSALETATSLRRSFLGSFSVSAAAFDSRVGSASQPPPVDLLFVLDKSGSVGFNHFATLIEHVQTLINQFPVPIASDQTRIAAISFSSANQVDLDFNFNACNSKATCVASVRQIDFEGGWTHTTRALNKARNEAFTTANGSRQNAHKVLFLITDGHSNGGGDVQAAANALKETGTEIYALAVTDNVNEDELKDIVSEPIPDHLFYYQSFHAMASASRFLMISRVTV